MADHTDPVTEAFGRLEGGDRPWPPGPELRGRAARRHRRRLVAGAGGTVLAAAVAVAVIAGTLGSSGGGRPAGYTATAAGQRGAYRVAVAPVSLGDGATHLVAHVTGDALPASGRGAARSTAQSEAAFGLALTQHLAGKGTANVLDSPLSAAAVLSMLELGARGATRAGIAEALQSPDLSAGRQAAGWGALLASLAHSGPAASIEVADSSWIDRGDTFTPGYLAELAQSFGNDAYQADFSGSTSAVTAATAAINAWVARETDGRIKVLFSPQQLAGVSLVLANALHFKAAWDPTLAMSDAPRPETFVAGDGRHLQVPAIRTEGSAAIPEADTATYRAVELPYAGGRYRAEVIQPTVESAGRFLAGLTPGALARVSASLRPAHVDLTMPSLALAGSDLLNGALSSMGMSQAFGDADLSGISPEAGAVSSVEQATRLVVDKDGTDAAAATGVSIASSAYARVTVLTIDRPYLFFLRDARTGLVLMSAVVEDPSAA